MSNSKVVIDFIEAWNQMDFDSISSALDENIFIIIYLWSLSKEKRLL